MDPNKPISTIMTTDLVALKPEDAMYSVKEIFDKHDFHHIPVLENGMRLVGIISKQDYLARFKDISAQTTGKTWTSMQYSKLMVSDLMTAHPMQLSPDDSIGLAADIFLANKFHALPIVDDDQLVGMITSHDLLRYAFANVLAE